MNYKLSVRDDEKVYVTFENGKTYRLEAILHNRQYQSDMMDLRERYTRRADKYDLENGKEARA